MYRGAKTITLIWEEDGERKEQDFSETEEAAAFRKELEQKLGANEEAKNEALAANDEVKKLEKLGASITELAGFLERVTDSVGGNIHDWEGWLQSYARLCAQCEEINKEWVPEGVIADQARLAKQNLTIEQLLIEHKRIEYLDSVFANEDLTIEEAVEDYKAGKIEGVTFAEMRTVYERYSKVKMESMRLYEAYKENLKKSETDEDELAYIINKLNKFNVAFGNDVISVEESQVRDWILKQPGSGSAKARLSEIIDEYVDFVQEETNPSDE